MQFGATCESASGDFKRTKFKKLIQSVRKARQTNFNYDVCPSVVAGTVEISDFLERDLGLVCEGFDKIELEDNE